MQIPEKMEVVLVGVMVHHLSFTIGFQVIFKTIFKKFKIILVTDINTYLRNSLVGQPDGQSFASEECVTMFTSNGKWSDVSCDQLHSFICEKSRKS